MIFTKKTAELVTLSIRLSILRHHKYVPFLGITIFTQVMSLIITRR